MLSCLLVISEQNLVLDDWYTPSKNFHWRCTCIMKFQGIMWFAFIIQSIAYNFVWSGIQYYIIMHTTLFNTESYDITCFILWNNTVYLYNMILPVHIRQNKKNRIHRIYRLSTMTSGYKQDFHYYVPYPAPRLWNHLGCS